jgi:hypothetical protein
MIKTMSHINNIELVQDLDHEAAATVSGGALYLHNKKGKVVVLTSPDADLGAPPGVDDFNDFNNPSSYRVTGNRNWYVYSGKNFKGKRYLLKAGTKGNFTVNSSISSVRPSL